MSDELRTFQDIEQIGKEVEEAAIAAWAEELDEQGFTKGEQDFSDWFGANDYSAEDLAGTFAWIPKYFLGCCGANPEQFDDIISSLDKTLVKLRDGSILDLQEQIRGSVEGWDGAGASSFHSFWAPTWEIVRNQNFLVTAMLVNIKSNRELLVKARSDLYEIGVQTRDALSWYEWWGETSAQFVLYAFKLIKSVTMTVAPIGEKSIPTKAAVAIASTIWDDVSASVGEALEVPKSGGGDSGKDFNIGGTKVSEILDSMVKALDEVKNKIDEEELEIAATLQKAFDQIDEQGRNSFVAPRPYIADLSASELTTDDEGLGDPK